MKVITLIENSSKSNELKCEHGLALYIEVNDHKLLFDTGGSVGFIDNATRLGVDLTQLDLIVISHGHYDHTGGLVKLLQLNTKAKVVLKRELLNHQYFSFKSDIKSIGFPVEIQLYRHRFIFVDELFSPLSGVTIIPQIKQAYPLPKGNQMLYKTGATSLVYDDFSHELIMTVESAKGLVLLSGCAHNGILNCIRSVRENIENRPIIGVVGGFHLIDPNEFIKVESDEELNEIAQKLASVESIDHFYTGHCTGYRAFAQMQKVLGNRLTHLTTGLIIEF